MRVASPTRILAFAACAGLALWGLALGAESQKEFVLESDLQAQDELASQGASGNLIVLTALLVALGVGVGATLPSRRPRLGRVLPGLALAGLTYLGVFLTQTMWPFYVAVVEYRNALLTNSLLAANLPALPSILLAPLALLLGVLLGSGWALRRLWSRRQAAAPVMVDLLRGQAARSLLAAPFLAIAAWGNIALLLALPDDQPGIGPYFVVLPAAALACLALLGIAMAKVWQLGVYVRNARLANVVQETWQTLGRVEIGLVATIGLLAVAATFLPAAALMELELGRVLGLTLRSHTQLLLVLAIPLLPNALLHRRIARRLQEQPRHAATLDEGTHPVAFGTVLALGAAVALAGISTWAFTDALWAWLLACLPGAALAATRLKGHMAAVPVLLLAFVLWAIGNTVQASYDGSQGTAILAFTTPPGLLALWRTLGAVVAAVALARLAYDLGGLDRRAWPAAIGAGAALAGVALLEMPLTAWLLARPGVDAIAVGSVVASLDAPVRITLHIIAALFALGAAVLVAFLQRPDWFQRPPHKPHDLDVKARAGTPA